MPQRPLPIELVALILEPFHDIEDAAERRKVGESVGLVCKTWLPLGRGIVWHRVSIKIAGDERLAEGLVARTSSTAAIRHLVVESEVVHLLHARGLSDIGDVPAPDDDEFMGKVAAVKAVQVVQACVRLDSLAVDLGTYSELFGDVSRATATASLTQLHLETSLRQDFGAADLLVALGRFTSLKSLRLAIYDVNDTPLEPLDAPLSPKLPVATAKLDILVGDTVKARLIGDAVHALFNPIRMQQLVVTGLGATSPSFDWLSRYEYLDTVCLAALNGDDFNSAFTNTVEALSAHPRIRYVLFAYEPGTWPSSELPPASPVPLGTFLKALPPQVRRFVVQGLTFDDTLDLLDSPRVDKAVDDVRVELIFAVPGDDERRVRRETVVHRERTGVGVSWALLQRDGPATLAALCRLAKAYQADAERALYSDVRLSWGDRSSAQPEAADPVPPGLALHTLVHNARLRPLVKSLEVSLHGGEVINLEVAALLQDLPGVETYSTERYPGASTHDHLGGLRQIVSNEGVRIRTLDVGTWTTTAAALVREHPRAFSTLKHLKLERLYEHHWVAISGPSIGIETLSLEVNVGPRTFARLTSPFSKTLLSLRLPVTGGEDAQGVQLRPFIKLERLDLLVPKKERGPAFQDAIPNVVSLLLSAASLRHLASLTIQETVVQPPLDYLGTPPESTQLSMSATHILNAVPFQIEQLTLDAPDFLATDLVDWILSPCRPPALKSLRIGGETGVGLNKLLRRTVGRYAELARTLEEAGIKVTTLP
ncbi:hypothetical protein JCM9279_002754 [Rhodotorula babjevae]